MERTRGSRTAARFVAVDDAVALDELIERSRERPVLLFNVDPSCGVSSAVRRDVATLDAEVAVVDVHANHELGQLVARRTGVRHESPQVIVLKDGSAVWSASHFAITAGAVRQALAEHGR